MPKINKNKKHNCPYLDCMNRCTHKEPKSNLRTKRKKLRICPYSNPIKCKYYSLWLKDKKSIVGLPTPIEELLEKEAEGYYD